MSKRELKKYLYNLQKDQLEEQIIELYEKFNTVKVYYNFAFNPNEEKLVQEAKFKIANEYFPVNGKRAKLRRSISQHYVKHFKTLGVDSFKIVDVMLYSIEIAQNYTAKKSIKQDLFFKSMLHLFEQSICFMIEKNILHEFQSRVVAINEEAFRQEWMNTSQFNAIVERFDY